MEDAPTLKSAVNGWKQAVGIVERQHEAIEYASELISRWSAEGRLPKSEALAEEFHHTFELARKLGYDYVKAMRTSGAIPPTT